MTSDSHIRPLIALELLCAVAWGGFLVFALRGGRWSGRRLDRKRLLPLLAVSTLLIALGMSQRGGGGPAAGILPAAALTLIYALALVLVEQIVRNARGQAMTHIMLLGVGLVLLLAFDLLIFARRLFSDEYAMILWQARGYVTLLALPFVAVWTWHPPSTPLGLFVSRTVVFHSATAVVVLVALSLLAFVSLFSAAGVGEWAGVVRVVLPAAGVALILLLLLSESQRTQLRRYIVRHFFASKYDLGAEWQRLTDTLSLDEADLPAGKRAVKSLADISAPRKATSGCGPTTVPIERSPPGTGRSPKCRWRWAIRSFAVSMRRPRHSKPRLP